MDKNQSDWLQKSFAISGILGPVINAILFTILGIIYPGYNPIRQLISELATSDAPHNIIMNILGFNLFGLYMVLFGFSIYRGIIKHILTTISNILFIFSGICIFTLSMFPCDPGCRSITLLGIGNNLIVIFPSIAIPLGIALLVYPLWRDNNWRNYSWFFFLQLGIFLVIFSPLIIYLGFLW